jgi:hypothetical protein
MDKWFIELFGINRLNFYGWVFTGALVILICLGLAGASVATAPQNAMAAVLIMLGAIAFLLLGIFGVLLQIYCSLLVEKLQAKDELLRQINERRDPREQLDENEQPTDIPTRDQYATKA